MYPQHLGRAAWNVRGFLQATGGVRNEYGEPDETISSVLGRRAAAGKLRAVERLLVRLLDKIDRNHAAEAIEREWERPSDPLPRHRVAAPPR